MKGFMRKQKTPRQKIIKKLDAITTKLVMHRDNRTCVKCGKKDLQLNTSHVVGRTLLHLRWNLNNVMCLCFYCHLRWWHEKPLEAADWFRETFPERNKYLEEHKIGVIKYTTQELEDMYQSLNQIAIQVGAI